LEAVTSSPDLTEFCGSVKEKRAEPVGGRSYPASESFAFLSAFLSMARKVRDEIPEAVNPGAGKEPRVHVYVGDMIQIQRMSRNPRGYPIDLDINLYTDRSDVITPLFLAPFGRKHS
jgi:hypothetical protein